MTGDDDTLIPEDDDILIPSDEEVGLKPAEPDKPEVAAKSAEEGIEDLKRQLDAERLARADMERQARANAEEAGRFRTAAEKSRADNLANAVDLATQEIEKQKAAYKVAMDAGDHAAAADAQAALSEAAAAKTMASQARAAFDAQLRSRPEPKPAAQYTPATQEWISKHPEFLTDERFKRRAFAAHGMAEADGLTPDTPQYFERIEALMGLRQEPAKRQAAPVSAPVSRSAAPSGRGKAPGPLSAEEKEMAEMMGIDPLVYARNRDRLAAEPGR